MAITDKIVIRQLKKPVKPEHIWMTPEQLFAEVRRFVALANEFPLPKEEIERRLRTHPIGKEMLPAALFTYGLKYKFPSPLYEWELLPYEIPTINREADFYVRVFRDKDFIYKPVQLKTVVPLEKPGNGIQDVINGLKNKYISKGAKSELVVAIYVDRTLTINFRELEIPDPADLGIEQLWFFGMASPNTGFMAGGSPGNIHRYEFPIPDSTWGDSLVTTSPSRP